MNQIRIPEGGDVISCDEYDYIEIACMQRYPIKLTLKSAEALVEGVAIDTQRNKAREECVQIDVNGTIALIVLDDISKLEVCVENPHFKMISFGEQCKI